MVIIGGAVEVVVEDGVKFAVKLCADDADFDEKEFIVVEAVATIGVDNEAGAGTDVEIFDVDGTTDVTTIGISAEDSVADAVGIEFGIDTAAIVEIVRGWDIIVEIKVCIGADTDVVVDNDSKLGNGVSVDFIVESNGSKNEVDHADTGADDMDAAVRVGAGAAVACEADTGVDAMDAAVRIGVD